MWLMLFFLEYFSLSDEYHQKMNFLQTLSLIASHLNRVVTSYLPGLPFQVDPTTKSGHLKFGAGPSLDENLLANPAC